MQQTATGLPLGNTNEQCEYCLEKHLEEFKIPQNPLSVKEKLGMYFSGSSKVWLHRLKRTVPIIDWLPKYSWKNDLKYDISAGITVGVMQISQGLAYGVLASLNAASGLYVSIFPGIFYAIFGSSRFVHLGTFAVVSLMVASVLNSEIPINYAKTHQNPLNHSEPMDIMDSKLVVSATLSFTVGIMQIIMYFIKAGIITKLISPTVVNGFIFGVSIHVLTTQISALVGIVVPSEAIKYSVGTVVQRFSFMFSNISTASWITFIIGSISMIYLFVFQFFKEAIIKRIRFPFPAEFLLIIIATGMSYGLKLKDKYNVPVVEFVPTGFPFPVLPDFMLLSKLLVNALIISVITFAIDSSIAKDLASRKNQVVDSNQELLALGIANTVCSFFRCFVVGSSLARSVIAFNMAVSQIFTLVSALFMTIVVLAAASLFYHLPKSILSAIIIIALVPIFKEIRILKSLWTKSKLEMVLWLITTLSVIFVGIEFGLVIGVAVCLLVNLFRLLRPTPSILGYLPKASTYKDVKYYRVIDYNDITIISFNNPLFYMNVDNFEEYMCEKIRELSAQYQNNDEEAGNNESPGNVHNIILDLQSSFFIDLAGVNALNKVIKFAELNLINILLCGANVSVLEQLESCQVMEVLMFPTITEARRYLTQ